MAERPSLLNQSLGPPVGTTQRPLTKMSDKFQVIAGGDGLPNYATVVEDTSAPDQSASMSSGNPRFCFKLDRGSLVAMGFFLRHASLGDLGSKVLVVFVTERQNSKNLTYQRRVVAKVSLHASSSAGSAADVDAVPNDDFFFVDAMTVNEDYTLSPYARVIGDAAGAFAELLLDFVGNGWIEIYGDLAKGTLGTNNAQGIWGEFRIL